MTIGQEPPKPPMRTREEIERDEQEAKANMAKALAAVEELKAEQARRTAGTASPSPIHITLPPLNLTIPPEPTLATPANPVNLSNLSQKDQEKIIGSKLTPKEEVEDFIERFGFTESLTDQEFKNLSEAQQLKVVRDLKRRVVDTVKSDAQTQYSEDLRKKMADQVAGNSFLSKAVSNLKKFGIGLKEGIKKEHRLKEIEGEVFENLKNTPEGGDFLTKEFKLLTKGTSSKEIYIDEKGNPYTNYIKEYDRLTAEQKEIAGNFNRCAEEFQNMPYEWGQGTGKNKKRYDKAKAEYEEARNAMLSVKEHTNSYQSFQNPKGKAVLEMSMIDNAVKMEQVLNTHPEFEKELQKFAENPSALDSAKRTFFETIKNKFGTKVGLIHLGIAGLGYGARSAVKGAALATSATGLSLLAAPIISGGIGYWRGKMRGKEILAKKKVNARYGEKNKGKERVATLDSESLHKKLSALTNEVEILFLKIDPNETAKEKGVREKKLALLSARIDLTRTKIDIGEVNFGGVKSMSGNLLNLVESMNKALVLKEAMAEKNNEETQKRIERMLNYSGEGIRKNTSKEQDKFKTKQAWEGAKIGAMAGLAGYGIRSVMEGISWLKAQGNIGKIDVQELPEIPVDTKTGEQFVDSTNQWIADSLGIEKDSLAVGIQDTFPPETTVTESIPPELTVEESAPVEKTVPETNIGTIKGVNQDSIEVAEQIRKDSIDRIRTNLGLTVEDETPIENTAPETSTYTTNQDSIEVAEQIRKDSIDRAGIIPPAEVKDTTSIPNTEEEINTPEVDEDVIRGAKINFELTLGKDGVPKNLETIFNGISADYMDLPADGKVTEEFATKSLNIAANLVKLTEGHTIAGLDAKEFAKIADFKNGVLNVKDHAEFNKILSALKENADKKWADGVLQGEGKAVSYIKNISQDNWLKIVHADGLHENADGVNTGIDGHQEVTKEQITDFDKSEIVKKAIVLEKADASDGVGSGGSSYELPPQKDADITLAGDEYRIPRQVDADISMLEPRPLEDLVSNGDASTPKVPESKPETNAGYTTEGGSSTGNDSYDDEPYGGKENALTEAELSKETEEVYSNHIEKLFPTKKDLNDWELVRISKFTTADLLMEKESTETTIPAYKNLINYLHELRKVTGLEPIKQTPTVKAETNQEYIKRALKWAVKNKKINDIEIF